MYSGIRRRARAGALAMRQACTQAYDAECRRVCFPCARRVLRQRGRVRLPCARHAYDGERGQGLRRPVSGAYRAPGM